MNIKFFVNGQEVLSQMVFGTTTEIEAQYEASIDYLKRSMKGVITSSYLPADRRFALAA